MGRRCYLAVRRVQGSDPKAICQSLPVLLQVQVARCTVVVQLCSHGWQCHPSVGRTCVVRRSILPLPLLICSAVSSTAISAPTVHRVGRIVCSCCCLCLHDTRPSLAASIMTHILQTNKVSSCFGMLVAQTEAHTGQNLCFGFGRQAGPK